MKKKGREPVRPFLKKDFDKIMIILRSRVDQASRHPESPAYYIARRNYMIFRLGVNFGLRQSDLMALTTDSVADGVISFTAKKTGKSDRYAYNKELWDEIRNYEKEFKMKPGEYLFRGLKPDHRTLRDTHLDRKQLDRIIQKAAKEAGIRYHVATHSLRKSYATWLYEDQALGGDDITIVQDALQHGDPRTTKHYLGITSEGLQHVRKKINFGASEAEKKQSKK